MVLTHSSTHLLTHSLTHLLTHSLTYSLTHSPTHSITHLLTYSLTHLLTHLLLGIADIWSHPFFRGIKLEDINIRHLTPPFVPLDDDASLLDSVNLDDIEAADSNAPPYTGEYDYSAY